MRYLCLFIQLRIALNAQKLSSMPPMIFIFETWVSFSPRVVNQARAFRGGSGLGQARAWILTNCRASIGPDAGVKSRFYLSLGTNK